MILIHLKFLGFELDLACLAALRGEIMMSQDVRFRGFGKGSESRFCLIPAPAWNCEILPTPIDYFLVLGYEVSLAFS